MREQLPDWCPSMCFACLDCQDASIAFDRVLARRYSWWRARRLATSVGCWTVRLALLAALLAFWAWLVLP